MNWFLIVAGIGSYCVLVCSGIPVGLGEEEYRVSAISVRGVTKTD